MNNWKRTECHLGLAINKEGRVLADGIDCESIQPLRSFIESKLFNSISLFVIHVNMGGDEDATNQFYSIGIEFKTPTSKLTIEERTKALEELFIDQEGNSDMLEHIPILEKIFDNRLDNEVEKFIHRTLQIFVFPTILKENAYGYSTRHAGYQPLFWLKSSTKDKIIKDLKDHIDSKLVEII